MYMYAVVKEFLSSREGQISVSPGELVEVLEEVGKYCLVCTIPFREDELEREGLVPAECLVPVRQGEWRVGLGPGEEAMSVWVGMLCGL